MTSVKMTVTDPTSVSQSSCQLGIQQKISDLETQISRLQKESNSTRELLRSLLHDPKRPSGFNEQVEMHSANIIQLRNQANSLKAEYNGVLYQAYR